MSRNCVRLKLFENGLVRPAVFAVGGELDSELAANGAIIDSMVECSCGERLLHPSGRISCGACSGNPSIPSAEPVVTRPSLQFIRVRTLGGSFATIPLARYFSFILNWFS